MEGDTLQKAIDALVPLVTRYGLQILGALLILILGKILSGIVGKVVERTMVKSKADPSLIGFAKSMASIAVMVFAVIAALAKFGIQTTSFVAVMGAAGFAIGLALQGSLGNFAAGVLMLVFKPIKVGDLVETNGYTGHVTDIGIFVTTLSTLDNRKIIVPNAAVTGSAINNINGNGVRRVDLVAGISYGDDMRKAKEVLSRVLAEHPKVLADPAPTVAVSELGDSSVNLVVRPWCNADDYWDVYFDVTQSMKEELEAAGLSIPFPQRDVHLFQTSANPS